MSFFAHRQRQQEFAEREAAGENLWTQEFDNRARQRILYALDGSMDDRANPEDLLGAARNLVLKEEGLPYLAAGEGYTATHDVQVAIRQCDPPLLLSLLEACSFILRLEPARFHTKPDAWEKQVNTILREHRIAYELVDWRLIPFESQEMHAEVVAPTLRLLSGRTGWEEVEKSYQDALREDDPKDAITDAARALQQALEVRGCDGNAIGPLLKDAKKKGILAPHDPTLGEGIGKIVDSVSADRSEKGDGHKHTNATPEDAWLAVHVVGALILRLASGSDRSIE